jgi:hypothetical protein
LWESEEAMVATRDAANMIRSEALNAMGSKIIDVTECEVGLADLP